MRTGGFAPIDHCPERMKTQGIFRVPGPASEVNKLQTLMEGLPSLEKTNLWQFDTSAVATVLKAMLRNMNAPLMTFEVYDWCVAIQGLFLCKEV